ncbi:MAG: helix-turn-helix transcriptional regulator [Polaromonas sp.]|uniref:AraC family transcriptional regulator n=1 Tax=Polaromonas sp. TaxID=1869339 RepID=UPI0027326AFE|nr:helix-turn-helix transcriptional regulator [Polaromonas sp.]MDP2817975.1 helix-turn-helix transcriptional regulator [Polaromonas sp.]
MPRPSSPFPARPALISVDGIDAFTPSPARPVRVRARSMPADTHFKPHRHGWAQLAYCASGILQVTAATPDEVTYIVPPSRAVWIAPGALHAINVLEAAEFRTLYLHADTTPAGWQGCRVIVVSPLLREMVLALDAHEDSRLGVTREAMLSGLLIDEITHADTQPLGVPMPHAEHGDKRLRALCEAVLRAPAERATLAEWAADMGASERTMARLFRDELGTSYQQWRQQAILAHALPLLARGTPVSQVAAASGYASDSAFSAMFKAAMGQSPSYFQNKKGL